MIELAAVSGALKRPRIFYIGFPVLLVTVLIFGLPMGPFFTRLSHARVDKRLNSFADSWAARFVNAWLVLIAVNFAHEEGRPKRWYHYMSNVTWGKYS